MWVLQVLQIEIYEVLDLLVPFSENLVGVGRTKEGWENDINLSQK
jgi:hypothetical protein